MERLAVLCLVLASCSSMKAKTCQLGDVVRFVFSERNLFYADICNNYGEVADRMERSSGTQYLVNVECRHQPSWPEGIWIDAEDITGVIRLGKDRYK